MPLLCLTNCAQRIKSYGSLQPIRDWIQLQASHKGGGLAHSALVLLRLFHSAQVGSSDGRWMNTSSGSRSRLADTADNLQCREWKKDKLWPQKMQYMLPLCDHGQNSDSLEWCKPLQVHKVVSSFTLLVLIAMLLNQEVVTIVTSAAFLSVTKGMEKYPAFMHPMKRISYCYSQPFLSPISSISPMQRGSWNKQTPGPFQECLEKVKTEVHQDEIKHSQCRLQQNRAFYFSSEIYRVSFLVHGLFHALQLASCT